MAFHVICLMFVGLVWYSIYQEHKINKLRGELVRNKDHGGFGVDPFQKH